MPQPFKIVDIAAVRSKYRKFTLAAYGDSVYFENKGVLMKKAILRRTADAMEKLAIGSMLVGLFQGQQAGILIGLGFLAGSYIFTVLEAAS